MGPSAASTSSSTPSTMFMMRSTSPPKSAWPGVSTMLILTIWPVSGIGDGDGSVLGEDGDAALALQVVGIHDALGHLLVLAEGVRLAQEAIHQRGLAVVHVGDDGDVTKVGSFGQHKTVLSISASKSIHAKTPATEGRGLDRSRRFGERRCILSEAGGLRKGRKLVLLGLVFFRPAAQGGFAVCHPFCISLTLSGLVPVVENIGKGNIGIERRVLINLKMISAKVSPHDRGKENLIEFPVQDHHCHAGLQPAI